MYFLTQHAVSLRVSIAEYRHHLPVSVLVFAAVSGLLVITNTRFSTVFGTDGVSAVGHIAGMLFHRGMAHYRGNMLVFVPFGVVLTALTSDRHVLGLIVLTHLPASILYAAFGGGIVGSSIAAMGIAAATLVRAIGEGMQDVSMEWLRAILLGILTAFLLVLLIVRRRQRAPGDRPSRPFPRVSLRSRIRSHARTHRTRARLDIALGLGPGAH